VADTEQPAVPVEDEAPADAPSADAATVSEVSEDSAAETTDAATDAAPDENTES